MERNSPIPIERRLTVRLTSGVLLVLLLIGVPFFIAFQIHLRNLQHHALEEATTTLSRLVVDGLGSSMLAGQPHLLDEAVRSLATQDDVERVVLLDHRGRVSITSDLSYEGRTLEKDRDESCVVCHLSGSSPPANRTTVIDEPDRRIFRAMSVIPNEPRCHACHDASRATNGILLMDLALEAADQRFFANVSGTLALGGIMLLVTIGVLALLLRRMVHAPLEKIVHASQKIVQGDLSSRASVTGSGEFELLGNQVNRMTDHLASSLQTVESQRRELQEILDAVDDEIVVLDRDRRVLAANRAFRHGIAPEVEPTGRPCSEVSGTEEPCAVDGPGGCPVQEVFRTGRLNKAIVSSFDASGIERTLEIHTSPLRSPDGRIEMVVEVRRDISERRQMEASMANSERLASIGLLASGISHEINNPLGAIATSVDGLRRRIGTNSGSSVNSLDGLDSILEKIARQVQRGRTITDRLLKIARPGARMRSLADLNLVVRDTLSVLSHHMQSHGIVPHLELASTLPPLRGDESTLGQMVMNLSLNAIQAMSDDGGTLRIATTCLDDAIQLDVEDNGCGIPAESVRRIYEPFFTTKPPGKGTGLGLFVTHCLVSEWNGTIQVTSEPGRGALFTVRIPLDRGRES